MGTKTVYRQSDPDLPEFNKGDISVTVVLSGDSDWTRLASPAIINTLGVNYEGFDPDLNGIKTKEGIKIEFSPEIAGAVWLAGAIRVKVAQDYDFPE